MKLASPAVFLLLIPLLLVAFYTWRVGVRRRARIFYPTEGWLKNRPKFNLPSPFKFHFVLRSLALLFMLVGLSRPQGVHQKTNRTVEALDLIICFDLSKSMLAIDFQPNRRTVAQNTVMSFVDMRVDDRIGLVLFSGEAFLAVPLTHDHKVVKEAILKSSDKGLQDGTAIGQALAVAVHHLRSSRAKSRVVVLVTDGDNNMGSVDPLTATELGKGYGIKMYAIGIGKKGRVAFPVRMQDPLGRETEIYQYLTDAINEPLLNEIANRTGGRAFRAAEDGVLEKIFATIDTLEKTKVETQTLTRYSEEAWPWIFIAFFLLLAEGIGLATRWRKIP